MSVKSLGISIIDLGIGRANNLYLSLATFIAAPIRIELKALHTTTFVVHSSLFKVIYRFKWLTGSVNSVYG